MRDPNRPPSVIRAIKGPITLITLGILFALNNFTQLSFDKTWPVLLIVFGLLSLAKRGMEPVPPPPPPVQPYPPPVQPYPPPAYATGGQPFPPPAPGGTYAQSPYTAPPAKGGFGSSAPRPADENSPPPPGETL